MTHHMIEKIGIWLGVVAGSLLGFALVPLMHFVPPPHPSASAAEIGALFRENSVNIRAGAIVMLATSTMFVPFYAVLSAHLERIEPLGSPLAKAQLMVALFAVFLPTVLCSTLWMVAAYRVERSDEMIQTLNDFAWMLFTTPAVAGLVQVFVIAAAVFADKAATPRFPRWYGYYNLWLGILFLPATLVPMFKTGVFAWNGLLSFWLGIAAFAAWFLPTVVLLLRAIGRDEAVLRGSLHGL